MISSLKQSSEETNPAILIKKWVQMHAAAMYRHAYSKTRDQQLAEDMVQETFIAASQSLKLFREESSAKTWLFSILKNKIADHYRSAYSKHHARLKTRENGAEEDRFDHATGHWTNQTAPSEWVVEEHLLDNDEFRKALQDCLGNLPSNWSLAMQMKFLEEKSSPEICQELNVTTTNYWQILHRAKLQLRECLEFKWFTK